MASELVKAASGESSAEDAPSFDELLALTVAIEYYFLPVGLESLYNPMCGMKDVLDFDRYLSQRTSDLVNIDGMLAKIQDEFIPKIESVLKENPEHPQALAKMEEIKAALVSNEGERKKVLEELELLNAFFTKFNNAIVFIGPEEKTFQDLAPTPFDSVDVPKVSVHGNLVKTLTSGLYLKRLPEWVDHLVTLGFCLAMAFISVYSGTQGQFSAGRWLVPSSWLCVHVFFHVFRDTCSLAGSCPDLRRTEHDFCRTRSNAGSRAESQRSAQGHVW